MNRTFGSTYARAYDLLYLDKDYIGRRSVASALWPYPAGHGRAPQCGYWVDALGGLHEYCGGLPPLCRSAELSVGAHGY